MTSHYGFLLDVDGPIASPVTRTVRPEISRILRELAAAGCPVVFNTGRSDAFVSQTVLPGILQEALPAEHMLHAICEKGATWFSITESRDAELHIDEDMDLPQAFKDDVQALVEEFSHLMFFDETKRAMVSVEQRTDVRNELYQRGQAGFDHKAAALIQKHGLGHRVRIDPTIISTDIEDNRLGKALGADRALELIRAQGADPAAFEWFTVGDSRTDYAMADRLHELGFAVTHVDVRPSDGIPEGKPYTIKTMPGVIHDDAGLAFLEEISASLSR